MAIDPRTESLSNQSSQTSHNVIVSASHAFSSIFASVQAKLYVIVTKNRGCGVTLASTFPPVEPCVCCGRADSVIFWLQLRRRSALAKLTINVLTTQISCSTGEQQRRR